MANKSKAIGTKAETRIVNFLKANGFSARRVALEGAKDKGDIHIVSPDGSYLIVLEVKAGKQTQTMKRKTHEGWLEQTRKETNHAGVSIHDGYLVIAKFGYSVEDYHVWSSDGRHFWYLDQWIEESWVRPARKEGAA